MKELILPKVIKVKNTLFVTIGFLNQGFKFQDYVCNGCHDLTMLCLNISNITNITVKNVDYRYIIHNSKSQAINLLKNYVLEDRGYKYKNTVLNFSLLKAFFFFFNFFCFAIYKMINSMDIFKSLTISVRTVMRNPEMVKFVPDHLKTKKM